MVASIGSSTGFSFTPTAKPTAGLEAQIARYKKELSNCVNCDSAKTSEGKANIQALSNKISKLTSQVQEISKSKQANQELDSSPATSLQKIENVSFSTHNDKPEWQADINGIGSRLNIFA